MSYLKKAFGKKLKFIRKAKGLTQEKLGELIDINQRQLTRIECGKNFPSADTLEKICYFLNVPIKQMFDFELEEQELIKTGTENTTYKAVKFGNIVKLEQVAQVNVPQKVYKYNNKQIECTNSDSEMINIAKKLNRPITVEYSENAETYKVIIYYPDGTFKHLKKDLTTEKSKDLEDIFDLLNDIANQPQKLKFIEVAINALNDKKSLEKLKTLIEGMELLG